MNHHSPWRAIFIALLVVLAGVALAVSTYHAAVAHGIAESGRVTLAPPAGPPYAYVGPGPWGFGFFPIFPFFFFLFFFFALRGLFWRGPWRGRSWRYDGVPPAFEEWHRRAHGQEPNAPRTSSGSTA